VKFRKWFSWRRLTNRKSEAKLTRGVTTFVVGVAVGVTATIVATLLIYLAEPDLVHVAGSSPPPPVVAMKVEDQRLLVFHVTIRPKFRNKGFKAGHLERLQIVPIGLTPYPEKIDVIYFDQANIGWRQTREIRSEFLVVIDPVKWPLCKNKPPEPNKMTFAAYFYGPGGRELGKVDLNFYLAEGLRDQLPADCVSPAPSSNMHERPKGSGR